eukprot:6198124-Pleurochrysis_carterae.AAC.1
MRRAEIRASIACMMRAHTHILHARRCHTCHARIPFCCANDNCPFGYVQIRLSGFLFFQLLEDSFKSSELDRSNGTKIVVQFDRPSNDNCKKCQGFWSIWNVMITTLHQTELRPFFEFPLDIQLIFTSPAHSSSWATITTLSMLSPMRKTTRSARQRPQQ